MHQQFDLAFWEQKFPLRALRRNAREFCEKGRREEPSLYKTDAEFERHIRLMEPGGEIICDPRSIAIVEQIRDEVWGLNPPEDRHATDVFIWALGDAQDPRVTRVGGIPWMEASVPWPRNSVGEALSFLGQVCFADSMDIAGDLPGDVLLLFFEGKREDLDPACYRGIWSRTDIQSPLQALPSDVPHCFERCYAHRHRTWAYPEDGGKFEGFKQGYLLGTLQATSIGNYPYWIQGGRQFVDETSGAPYKSIATFSAIHPRYKEQPFINRGRFDQAEQISRQSFPIFGDVGCLYVLLHPNGSDLAFEVQCY